MKGQKLPQIDSIQELASFWDSHDLADFGDELEEVKEAVFVAETSITLHLPRNEADAVRQLAENLGVAEADLIHKWVREKISL